ncbi:hypothetical protein BU16DRAFT_544881 [Lophium mytilinum]|uniref:Uncharacterized protein n=1 Tax=Lophium mytilinum TaxID=390894 RepID=A0A6A6QAM3_9PEZI|nr:hypothetical protein BU16DRAFT_544881 [Lophium mytilinum]
MAHGGPGGRGPVFHTTAAQHLPRPAWLTRTLSNYICCGVGQCTQPPRAPSSTALPDPVLSASPANQPPPHPSTAAAVDSRPKPPKTVWQAEGGGLNELERIAVPEAEAGVDMFRRPAVASLFLSGRLLEDVDVGRPIPRREQEASQPWCPLRRPIPSRLFPLRRSSMGSMCPRFPSVDKAADPDE